MHLLLSLLVLAAPALALSISGTLFDPSDAPVPVTTVALQLGRNIRTTGDSYQGSSGIYRVMYLAKY